jgi:hypothetical protein
VRVSTIQVGTAAPGLDAAFPDAEGVTHRIGDGLEGGPLLLAIYKSSCQASKVIFPMLERIATRYAGNGLSTFGVAQDSANITRSFARSHGITFPILIEGPGYPISNAFDVQATPTVVVIRGDGTVAYTTMGFLRDQINDIGATVAAELGLPPEQIVSEDEPDVPFFVPG